MSFGHGTFSELTFAGMDGEFDPVQEDPDPEFPEGNFVSANVGFGAVHLHFHDIDRKWELDVAVGVLLLLRNQ